MGVDLYQEKHLKLLCGEITRKNKAKDLLFDQRSGKYSVEFESFKFLCQEGTDHRPTKSPKPEFFFRRSGTASTGHLQD